MLCQINRVNALLVLFLSNVLAQRSPYSLSNIPSEADRCEDLNNFFFDIHKVAPAYAFELISLPLSCASCPPEIKTLRLELTRLISQGLLNINGLLADIPGIGNLNRYDVLITTLMAINEFLNVEQSVKKAISDAIFYLLKKRYLRIDASYKFADVNTGFCTYRTFDLTNYDVSSKSVRYQPIKAGKWSSHQEQHQDSDDCVCQSQIFQLLVNRLMQMEQRRKCLMTCNNIVASKPTIPCHTTPPSRISFTPPATTPQLPVPVTGQPPKPILRHFIQVTPSATPRSMSIHQENKENIELENLIQVVPAPVFPQEQIKFEKFKLLLNSPQVKKIVETLNIPKGKDNAERLDVIITEVLRTVKTEEVQEVFRYYSTFREAAKAHFNFATLLDVLPQPMTDVEQQYFNITKSTLTNKDIYGMKRSGEFDQAAGLNEKLMILLRDLIASNQTSQPQLKAARYYLPVVTSKQSGVNFASLISVLPKPTTEIEKKEFEVMRKILSGNDIYVMMQNISVGESGEEQRLNLVLRELISNGNFKNLVPVATHYRNGLVEKRFSFNYFDLINLINVTEENRQLIQTVLNYFYTPEFEKILSQLSYTDLSDLDKLLIILQGVQMGATDVRVKSAAEILVAHLQKEMFFRNMRKIIGLIPAPKTNNEEQYHKVVSEFLQTENAFQILTNIDFSLFPDNKILVQYIFTTILESNVDQKIKDAFEYYVDLAEKLANIEFVTKKEIKRNFKLTEIFTDTLDLKSLTLSQKNAFKKFFKFISEIKPTVLSKFDSWDQAKTRGEFMKLLFKYLLETDETHQDIRESIQVLNSLVKMTGKGALPP